VDGPRARVADGSPDAEAPGRADAGLGTRQEGFEIAGAMTIARSLEACTQIDERAGRVEPPIVPRHSLADAIRLPTTGEPPTQAGKDGRHLPPESATAPIRGAPIATIGPAAAVM
jgi:hypothetical protein